MNESEVIFQVVYYLARDGPVLDGKVWFSETFSLISSFLHEHALFGILLILLFFLSKWAIKHLYYHVRDVLWRRKQKKMDREKKENYSARKEREEEQRKIDNKEFGHDLAKIIAFKKKNHWQSVPADKTYSQKIVKKANDIVLAHCHRNDLFDRWRDEARKYYYHNERSMRPDDWSKKKPEEQRVWEKIRLHEHPLQWAPWDNDDPAPITEETEEEDFEETKKQEGSEEEEPLADDELENDVVRSVTSASVLQKFIDEV